MKTRVSVFVQCVCMTILGFITAVPTQATIIHSITPDQDYVDYGLNMPWVVPVGVKSNDSWLFNGSAVAIAPGVALFSAHQTFSDGNNTGSFDGYAVRFTSNFVSDPAERIEAYDMVRHPDYNQLRSGPDLALLFFHETEAFNALPELALYSGEHTVGSAYDIAGFGTFGTTNTGLQAITGDRRGGTNSLTSDSAFGGQFLQARFESPSSAAFQPLGLLGAPGDSGGWFLDVNGDIQLAAISSMWSGAAIYGASTYATPFTPETIAWINSEIHAHAVPEPSSLLLTLAGTGVLAFRRRRGDRASVA